MSYAIANIVWGWDLTPDTIEGDMEYPVIEACAQEGEGFLARRWYTAGGPSAQAFGWEYGGFRQGSNVDMTDWVENLEEHSVVDIARALRNRDVFLATLQELAPKTGDPVPEWVLERLSGEPKLFLIWSSS